MNLLRWLIRPYLYTRYYMEKWTKTGGFGPDPATFIKDPYTPAGNWVKDGLHRHYVKQFHESSCSVASVVSVVNTLKSRQDSGWQVITQHDLLDTVRAAHWKERMSENGYKGRRGLPLNVLGEVTKASLDVYQIDHRAVEIIQTTRRPGEIDQSRKDLEQRLRRFETEAAFILIAHFDQGTFLPEMHIPHISPVGGYDAETRRVKILDVDAEVPFSYEISFDRFYAGLSTNYNAVFRHYGYAEGGYILIDLTGV